MSEKEVAEQLVARVLALDSLQMNCSSMEVVPAALVHIDALLPLQLADRLQHTGCAPPISPNKQVDAQCEARPQPLPNPLFQSGWSTLDLFSDSVSLFDIPPGPDSGLALDLPDVDEVDGAAVHLPSESPQTAAVTRAQSPPLHEALSESDNYLVFLVRVDCYSILSYSGRTVLRRVLQMRAQLSLAMCSCVRIVCDAGHWQVLCLCGAAEWKWLPCSQSAGERRVLL